MKSLRRPAAGCAEDAQPGQGQPRQTGEPPPVLEAADGGTGGRRLEEVPRLMTEAAGGGNQLVGGGENRGGPIGRAAGWPDRESSRAVLCGQGSYGGMCTAGWACAQRISSNRPEREERRRPTQEFWIERTELRVRKKNPRALIPCWKYVTWYYRQKPSYIYMYGGGQNTKDQRPP